MKSNYKVYSNFQYLLLIIILNILNINQNNLNAQTTNTIINHCFLYPTNIGKQLSNAQEKRKDSYTYDISYIDKDPAFHFYSFKLTNPPNEIKAWGHSYSEIRRVFFSPDNSSLFFNLVELNEIKLNEPFNIKQKAFENTSYTWGYEYSKYNKYPSNNLIRFYNSLNYTTTICKLIKKGNEYNTMGIYIEHAGPSENEFSECIVEKDNKCFKYCIDGSFSGLNFKFKVIEYNNKLIDEKWNYENQTRSSEIFKPLLNSTDDFSTNIKNTFSLVNEAIDLQNQLKNNMLDKATFTENLISNLGTLFEPLNNLIQIIVDPNLKYIASVLNKKNEIFLWAVSPTNPKNIKTDNPFIILSGHQNQPLLKSISPDGRFIWSSDGKKDIIWDVTRQNIIFETFETIYDVDWHNFYIIINGPTLYNFINKKEVRLRNLFLSYLPIGSNYSSGFSTDGNWMYLYANKDKKSLGIGIVNLNKMLNREYLEIKPLIKEKFNIEISNESIKKICNNNFNDTLINYLRNSPVHKKTEFEKENDYKNRIQVDLNKLKDILVYLYESKYTKQFIGTTPIINTFKNLKDGEFEERVMLWDDFKYSPDEEKLCFNLAGVVACIDMTPEKAQKFKEESLYKKISIVFEKTFPDNQLYPNYDNLYMMYEKDGEKFKVSFDKQPLEEIMRELGFPNKTKIKNTSEIAPEKQINKPTNNNTENNKTSNKSTTQKQITNSNSSNSSINKNVDIPVSIAAEYWKLPSKDSSKFFSPYCYDVRMHLSENGEGFEERVVYCNKWTVSHIEFKWKIIDDSISFTNFTTLEVCGKKSDPTTHPVNDYKVKYILENDTLRMEGEKDHNGIKWVNKNAVVKNFINTENITDKDGNTYKIVRNLSKNIFSSQGTSYPKGYIKFDGKSGKLNYLQYAFNSRLIEPIITNWGLIADCSGNPIISTINGTKCYSLIVKLNNGDENKYQVWLNNNYEPESLLVGSTLWK